MPFTPFHLGPALGLGLPLRRYMHVPTFIVASVILDVEPFLVLQFGLNYPLHGYLHTFLASLFVGFLLVNSDACFQKSANCSLLFLLSSYGNSRPNVVQVFTFSYFPLACLHFGQYPKSLIAALCSSLSFMTVKLDRG